MASTAPAKRSREVDREVDRDDVGGGGGGGGGSGSGVDEAVFKPRIVFPGENITSDVVAITSSIRIGAGIAQVGDTLIATKGGPLMHKAPDRFWVDAAQKRYIPVVDDAVVGIVTDRLSEWYRIDMGGSSTALLPFLAFDGATKGNRPQLAVGALVYCRVVVAHKDMEPEVTCCVAGGPKKGWVTGESVFGELHGGVVVHTTVSHAHKLVTPGNVVLRALGASVPFEVAIGLNGWVWVRAGSTKHTVLVCNAVRNSAHLDDDHAIAMVKRLINKSR